MYRMRQLPYCMQRMPEDSRQGILAPVYRPRCLPHLPMLPREKKKELRWLPRTALPPLHERPHPDGRGEQCPPEQDAGTPAGSGEEIKRYPISPPYRTTSVNSGLASAPLPTVTKMVASTSVPAASLLRAMKRKSVPSGVVRLPTVTGVPNGY